MAASREKLIAECRRTRTEGARIVRASRQLREEVEREHYVCQGTGKMSASERWRELCAQAAVEKDPKRLLELVREITQLLEEKEKAKEPPKPEQIQ